MAIFHNVAVSGSNNSWGKQEADLKTQKEKLENEMTVGTLKNSDIFLWPDAHVGLYSCPGKT